MSIEPHILTAIRQEHEKAPRGQKGRVVDGWARMIGCSPTKIWNCLETGRMRKKNGWNEGQVAAAEAVFIVKNMPPECAGIISTDQALDIAIDQGLIPEGVRPPSVSTINRMGREMKLTPQKDRKQRFQAERPNQMHHVDASTSSCFHVVRVLSNGDCIFKLHKTSKHYKNKPTPVQLRPWIYALADDYSGYLVARYTAAPGEELRDNMDFLSHAWGRSDDRPFFGLPEKIKADHGPMMKGKAAQEWLNALGVEIDPSVPGAKDAHGKIERPWRTLWQRFERLFFCQGDWKEFEITMSELNRKLVNYLNCDYNQGNHRYENISREKAWRKVNLVGVRELPENALQAIARRERRKVTAEGMFSLDSVKYEVKGLHNAWVTVFMGIFDDKLVVQDEKTGERYECELFEPNKVDEFTGHKKTEYRKIREQAEELNISPQLFDKEAIPDSKVVPIPVRTTGKQSMDNPFDLGTYTSAEEAMADFICITGMTIEAGGSEWNRLIELFQENGLNKDFVREIASKVNAQQTRRVDYG